MTKNKKENEYRLEISKDISKKTPPKHVEGFELNESYEIEILDILFERKNNPLKNEDIGIRIRRIVKSGVSKMVFTYKKFLGLINEMAKFDEESKELSEKEYLAATNDGLNKLNLSRINDLSVVGEIYTLLQILNKRKVYIYSNGKTKLEMVIEQVEYRSGDKKAVDTLMEIEILSGDNDTDIQNFVETIKEMYKAKPVNEGKNSRGIRMLGIKI